VCHAGFFSARLSPVSEYALKSRKPQPKSRSQLLQNEFMGFYREFWDSVSERQKCESVYHTFEEDDPICIFQRYFEPNGPVSKLLRQTESMVLNKIVGVLYASIFYTGAHRDVTGTYQYHLSGACKDMAYAGPDLVGSHESFFWSLGTDRLSLALRLPSTMELLARLLSVYVCLDSFIQEKFMVTMLGLLEGSLSLLGQIDDSYLTPDELEEAVLDPGTDILVPKT
jgi:hypothetical protein